MQAVILSVMGVLCTLIIAIVFPISNFDKSPKDRCGKTIVAMLCMLWVAAVAAWIFFWAIDVVTGRPDAGTGSSDRSVAVMRSLIGGGVLCVLAIALILLRDGRFSSELKQNQGRSPSCFHVSEGVNTISKATDLQLFAELTKRYASQFTGAGLAGDAIPLEIEAKPDAVSIAKEHSESKDELKDKPQDETES